MDNSDTKKEAVSRTYQGVDGDTPIALYFWQRRLEHWTGTACRLPPLGPGDRVFPGAGLAEGQADLPPDRAYELDLERLPSGKFDTNDAIVYLASFAYNCLRLLGQLGLTGEIAPIRHPAKRRRLKRVLQEIMYRAAKFSPMPEN